MAVLTQKIVKPGLPKRVLAFLSNLFQSFGQKKVMVTGIGIDAKSNFNVFFQFNLVCDRKYNITTVELEAKNRYNLRKCTILDLTEKPEISFSFTPTGPDDQPQMDRVQYLQLS